MAETKKYRLKHRDSSLSQLAVQLRLHERAALGSIEVALFVEQAEGDDADYMFGLTIVSCVEAPASRSRRGRKRSLGWLQLQITVPCCERAPSLPIPL